MASAEFLEQALSTDVDKNAVNAIVDSLENQLVTSVPSVPLQNNIVNVIPDQINITINSTSIIGVQKHNTECISNNEVVHSSKSNFVSSNLSATSTTWPTFPAPSLGNGCLNLSSCGLQQSVTMQPPLVIKQGSATGQVGLQTGMVAVPMTVSPNISTSIPNVITINKPGQNVVATQNLGSAQPTILPNVQILNMRPGAPTVTSQKSIATVSPRVGIGAQQEQVVGTRATAPSMMLQTLQSLQGLQGQQGHLLVKTENGQYRLLRVGPASMASNLTAQTLRLSTVPAYPGVATISTSIATLGHIPGPFATTIATPIVSSSTSVQSAISPPIPRTVTTQKPPDNTTEKCRNFLANLLDLSIKNLDKSVERSVRNLIQGLIDDQVEPEEFCDRLERVLNASPQPGLIGFLKKSLPLLRQSLITKELVIEGINPPAPHVAFYTIPTPTRQVITCSNIQLQKPPAKPGGTIAVLQNIPVPTEAMTANSKANFTRISNPTMQSATLSTVLTPGKSLLNEKKKRTSMSFSSQPYIDEKMAGDDDINDVAAMGGVNLVEETERILGSTEMIGTQIRSCKDEYLIPMSAMQARIKAVSMKHGLEEPPHEVAVLLIHALHERLKNIVEKLAVIAQHRMDQSVKDHSRYDVTQDVKAQLKFLEERDRAVRKRIEDSEREVLLRAVKSRSKNEDSEQAKLKAKAKEMQRAELEELRYREANVTALQAIGPRKKPRLGENNGGSGDSYSNSTGQSNSGFSGRSQMALRIRIKRINLRDMLFLLDQEPKTARSQMLYRGYLK